MRATIALLRPLLTSIAAPVPARSTLRPTSSWFTRGFHQPGIRHLGAVSGGSPEARRGLHVSPSVARPVAGSASSPSSLQPSTPQTTNLHSGALPIRTVLIVKKENDRCTAEAVGGIVRYLHSTEFSSFLKSSDYHPQRTVKVLVEEQAIQELQEVGVSVGENVGVLKRPDGESPSSCSYPTSTNTINPPPGIDLIITLGGDGTILHLSSLYSTAGAVPPVLSFSMGSLGFLLPFHIEHYRETLKDVFQGTYGVLHRMRLACQVFSSSGEVVDRCSGAGSGWQVMNEVALHRGRYPHLSVVDAFVNGQHLTEAVADGLILATPTGSTAYSLSSGGPIAHPSINSFLLTPIAPRSLSFRTLLLPDNCEVKMQISHKSRASSELSMDGREVCILHPGEYITLRKSAFPIPCIVPKDGKDGWVADINSLLQFNVGFKNSSLWRGHTPV